MGQLFCLGRFPEGRALEPAVWPSGSPQSIMYITIQELELRKIEYAEFFAPGAVDFGPDFEQVQPLKAVGRAELIEENHGGKQRVKDIRIVGDFSTQMEIKCARCLEPVLEDVAREYDLLYRPLKTLREGEEIEISEAESEIGYYKGEGVLLEDVLKEQVLLALPSKVLCKPDCKGLCPHCGKDLNETECGCTVEVPDPRWAALAEIKDKLKH